MDRIDAIGPINEAKSDEESEESDELFRLS